MILGFALTEHCNLRCPHCIRDDVTNVKWLERQLIERLVDEALSLYGSVLVSFTGGEPLLHPDFYELAAAMSRRRVPYRFVTNGWHWRRIALLARNCPPQSVRLSLSGALESTHDAERGRGSFRRLLTSAAVLTRYRVPFALSLVVDRRSREEITAAADLAEALGAFAVHYILPQPTPPTAARGSDLAPEEWWQVKDAIRTLEASSSRYTRLLIDYGYPFEGPEELCQTFALRRIYVDTRGRLCTCCQLSNYGLNQKEVVADLHEVTLTEGYALYLNRLRELFQASRPKPHCPEITDPFPCLRCARASGKLGWLSRFPQSPWHQAAVETAPGTR
ncbi:Sporulation killing factor maturation protein SkfB [bacterium HR33]|nr:Sporulation killing factor maturation protein SkfB [bacterium HR33]